MAGRKYGASVFEIANRIAISNDTDGIAGVADSLADHLSGLNNNAHQINNISGLQTALDGKQSVLTGFTGSFSVVTHVNFPGEASTTKTITVSNGVIVSVV